ncbi:hypothetical protein LCGC14_2465580, partial [marine sediment metagenome]
GIRKAKLDSLNLDPGGIIPDGTVLAAREIPGNEFGGLPTFIREMMIGAENSGPTATASRLRSWRRAFNNELKLQYAAGNYDNAARIRNVIEGIDKQFDVAPGLMQGNAKQALNKANQFRKEVNDKLSVGFTKEFLKRDSAGRSIIAPEDFNRYWIRQSGQQGRIEAAKEYQRLFGRSRQAKDLIVQSVYSSIRNLPRNELNHLDHRTVQRWLLQRRDNLRAHGVWNRVKNISNTAEAAFRTRRSNELMVKDLENSILGEVVKTDDVSGWISNKIKNNQMEQARRQVAGTKDPAAMRAWTRAVWDEIMSRGHTKGRDTLEQVIQDADSMVDVLTNPKNKIDLVKGLGREHYNNALIVAKASRATEDVFPTFGTAPPGESLTRETKDFVRRSLSKIRASMQGFVSVPFTTLQVAQEGVMRLDTHTAQKLFQEVMYDPALALKLAKIARTKNGKKALEFAFTGLYTIPGYEIINRLEDPRTEE